MTRALHRLEPTHPCVPPQGTSSKAKQSARAEAGSRKTWRKFPIAHALCSHADQTGVVCTNEVGQTVSNSASRKNENCLVYSMTLGAPSPAVLHAEASQYASTLPPSICPQSQQFETRNHPCYLQAPHLETIHRARRGVPVRSPHL
jgi:hypothetical protein